MYTAYPTPDQQLLLEALLLPDDPARRSAKRWLDGVIFDDLDLGTRRLLPLFHRRMLALGIDHELEGRIRGIYRRAWYVDRNYRHLLDQLLDQFAGADIPVVLLKGPALGLTIYADPALRPYEDYDLLLPADRLEDARALMLQTGHTIFAEEWHALTMRKADHPDVDLHVSPFHEIIRPDRIAPLWERSRTLDMSGRQVCVLAAEDQLRHILTHGLRRNSLSPVRWVVDAVHQLRAVGKGFDWDLFVREAVRLGMVESSIRGLRYIRRFDASLIDARALAALEARSTAVSRTRWYFECEYGGPLGAWFTSRYHVQGFARVPYFFRQYARVWGVSRPLPFLAHVLSRAYSRAFAR